MRFTLLGLLTALTLTTAAAGQALTPAAKKAGWHSDYRAAREVARRTGKPLFVVFRCQP